jgi:hypothetical protein
MEESKCNSITKGIKNIENKKNGDFATNDNGDLVVLFIDREGNRNWQVMMPGTEELRWNEELLAKWWNGYIRKVIAANGLENLHDG